MIQITRDDKIHFVVMAILGLLVVFFYFTAPKKETPKAPSKEKTCNTIKATNNNISVVPAKESGNKGTLYNNPVPEDKKYKR